MEVLKTTNINSYKVDLSEFKTVNLQEMNKAAFMNRIDNKFLLNQNRLPAILEELRKYYSLLEINAQVNHSYTSLYFDTNNLDMYLNHHNKRLNRYKIRQRRYNTTGESFLEIKKKNNRGAIKKKRIRISSVSKTIPYKKFDFITENLPYSLLQLRPTLTNEFYRFTLTNLARSQRITIDTNINLSNGLINKCLDGLVIVEVKSDKNNLDKTIFQVLRRHWVYPERISKYSIGMALLHPELKQNLFKEKIHLINKIRYGV